VKDGKRVILCIDDEQEIRESLTIILEANGYLVFTAANAKEGLELYKKEKPDFILVDLVMESVDSGIAIAEELRSLDNEAPLYLLSSAGDSLSSTADYNELGFSGVMQKPINPDQLLKTIHESLH
jgi:DNA-binding response OmpR family regulator